MSTAFISQQVWLEIGTDIKRTDEVKRLPTKLKKMPRKLKDCL